MFIQNFEAQRLQLPNSITCDAVYFPLADKASVKQSVKSYEVELNVSLNDEIKECLWKYSGGDGKLTKQLVLLALQKKEFVEILLHGSVKEVYSAIGEQYLNMRFEQIINALQIESIQRLIDGVSEVSECLMKTNLVATQTKKVYTPLFEYYIQNNLSVLAEVINAKKSDNPLLHLLTGKEYELYSYLKEHSGFNNKSNIGFALWESKSGEKYSLWTLDKIVSNLRKKLNSNGKLGKIVTIRNKGVQLITAR
jgi:hypothetical protein